jgi:AcrR family transcriptional regulator
VATRISGAADSMKKQPQQTRSRVTVDAILEGAAHILARHGWAGFTTNAVAEAAGVSIGSLYQYFPDKMAIVDSVLQQHFDEILAVLRSSVGDDLAAPCIERLVSGMIAAHSEHSSLHHVLLEDVPFSKTSKKAHEDFEQQYQQLYTRLLAGRARTRSSLDEFRAHVLSAAIEGVIHDAARRGTVGSPILEQELVSLAKAYLDRSSSR